MLYFLIYHLLKVKWYLKWLDIYINNKDKKIINTFLIFKIINKWMKNYSKWQIKRNYIVASNSIFFKKFYESNDYWILLNLIMALVKGNLL